MRSVPASGDCFYDAMHLALAPSGRPDALADAGAMRDTVAESITGEILALMRMYAEAGVEGFEWLTNHRAPTTLEEVRAFARRRGTDTGAGQCLWADEHALQVVASLANVRLLVYDEQAPAPGSRSGRTRGQAGGAADARFVSVGDVPSGRVVILHSLLVIRAHTEARTPIDDERESLARGTIHIHSFTRLRSRRQHYSPVFLDGKGVLEVSELPPTTRARWPGLGRVEASSSAPKGGDDGKKRKRS